MRLRLLLLAAIITIIACSHPYFMVLDAVNHLPAKDQFKVWHFLNKKSYSLNSEEALIRYKNFKENMKYIKQKNSEQTEFQLGLTLWADISEEEIEVKRTKNSEAMKLTEEFNRQHAEAKKHEEKFMSFDEEADKVDMGLKRNLEDTTQPDWSSLYKGVRNQQTCGSCWAFTAVGTIEGWAVKDKVVSEFTSLSPQMFLDCDSKQLGCKGGDLNFAFDFALNHGTCLEKDYPYENLQFDCKRCEKATTINNFNFLEGYFWSPYKYKNYDKNGLIDWNTPYDSFEAFSRQGPYAGYIDANKDLYLYKSGILDSWCSSVNHAVIVVQLDVEKIKIRNSWGEGWGEGGYARVKRAYRNRNNYSCYLTWRGLIPHLNK